MVLSFAEMEARDLRARLEPDGREQIEPSACPCGKPVVEVEEAFDMIGGRNHRRLRYYHDRANYCQFVRRF